MRARVWLPEVGVFSAIDELAYHDATSTLWGWPGQNPHRYSDPDGRNALALAGGSGITVAQAGFYAGVVVGVLIAYDLVTNDGRGVKAVGDALFKSPAREDSKPLLAEDKKDKNREAGQEAMDEEEAKRTAEMEGKADRKGSRAARQGRKALTQRDEVADAQRTARERGMPHRIESTEKSEQRADNELKLDPHGCGDD